MLRSVKKERPAEASGSERSARAEPPRLQTVGSLLAQARQKSGQSLQEVAQSLCIKASYLQAIEQDRYADLPGLTYAVGFVRSYGDYLGLDGKSLVQRYKDEAQGVNRAPQLSFPSLPQEAKVPTGAIILVSLILLAVAYGGWVYFSRYEEAPPSITATLSLPAVSTQAPSGGDATTAVAGETPAAQTNDAASSSADSAATNPAGADPAPTEGTAPAAAPEPPAAPALAGSTAGDQPGAPAAPATAVPDGSLGAPLAAPVAPLPGEGQTTLIPPDAAEGGVSGIGDIPSAPPAPAAAATQQAAAPASGSRIVLRATLDSWIRVSDAKDQAIFTQVLRAGESYEVPDQAGLVLLTGNAGGLVVEVDGKALPPLGAVGAVRRNIALDPDALLNSVN